MTIDEIKAISIKDYLGSMSIYPIKNYGYYGMYKSPFRNEHTPSFKVDYNQNLWYDFALAEGGSLIDLIMKYGSRKQKMVQNSYLTDTQWVLLVSSLGCIIENGQKMERKGGSSVTKSFDKR